MSAIELCRQALLSCLITHDAQMTLAPKFFFSQNRILRRSLSRRNSCMWRRRPKRVTRAARAHGHRFPDTENRLELLPGFKVIPTDPFRRSRSLRIWFGQPCGQRVELRTLVHIVAHGFCCAHSKACHAVLGLCVCVVCRNVMRSLPALFVDVAERF